MIREPLTRIKVMLADDHPFIREGVRALLGRHRQFEVIAEASNGHEAILEARASSPDVIVMDISMPGIDGLEATECLREICPACRVLILTIHEKKDFVRELVQSGARGYLRKDTAPEELVSAIERVHHGETFFRPEVAEAFFNDYVQRAGGPEALSPRRLSDREHEVLSAIVEGLSNAEIAARMGITTRTVEKHRQRIMAKLGIHKVTELVAFAITRGFVDLSAL